MEDSMDIPPTDISTEEALDLANQELRMWVRTKYLLQKRLEVMNRQGLNGDTEPQLKELTNCEIAIEMWKQEIISLQK